MQEQNGKSLEFAICREFLKTNTLDPDSEERYARYERLFYKLNPETQHDFHLCGRLVAKHFLLSNEIARLNPDNAGTASGGSDVADLIVGNIPLSIKNTRSYEKSHRPSALASQAQLDATLQNEWNALYSTTVTQIYEQINQFDLFRNLSSDSLGSVRWTVLEPVYQITCEFFELMNMDEHHAYYRFIMGGGDFYQCINMPKKVVVNKRPPLETPIDVQISRNSYGHIILKYIFDQSFVVVGMRLHTCSGRIKPSLDLKFDAHLLTEIGTEVVLLKF